LSPLGIECGLRYLDPERLYCSDLSRDNGMLFVQVTKSIVASCLHRSADEFPIIRG